MPPDAKPPDQPAAPPAMVKETDWQPLFDGVSLKGWTVYSKKEDDNWGVEKGVLFTRGLDRGWLMTEEQYGDFELRLEYRATPKANSGVALRAPLEGDPSFTGHGDSDPRRHLPEGGPQTRSQAVGNHRFDLRRGRGGKAGRQAGRANGTTSASACRAAR